MCMQNGQKLEISASSTFVPELWQHLFSHSFGAHALRAARAFLTIFTAQKSNCTGDCNMNSIVGYTSL